MDPAEKVKVFISSSDPGNGWGKQLATELEKHDFEISNGSHPLISKGRMMDFNKASIILICFDDRFYNPLNSDSFFFNLEQRWNSRNNEFIAIPLFMPDYHSNPEELPEKPFMDMKRGIRFTSTVTEQESMQKLVVGINTLAKTHFSPNGEEGQNRESPGTILSESSNLTVKGGKSFWEVMIRIAGDLDKLSRKEKMRFLKRIASILGLDDVDPRDILGGSIKFYFDFTPQQVEMLRKAVEKGELDDFNLLELQVKGETVWTAEVTEGEGDEEEVIPPATPIEKRTRTEKSYPGSRQMREPAPFTYEGMLEAGVHFGHLTRKWNPAMAPYIFMERNGIHVIDLNKTLKMLEEASRVVRQLAASGRKILFVATKNQAKDIVAVEAIKVNMPYVTERWLGGMLTNFSTVRKSIRKMGHIEKMEQDGTFDTLNKKERLMLTREKAKLEKVLKGISMLNRLPSALFIVDIKKEHIAVKEARKLNIPTIAMVDTNSDPNMVDFPIPANDDAAKSIQLVLRVITNAILEGQKERNLKKEEEKYRARSTKKIIASEEEIQEESNF